MPAFRLWVGGGRGRRVGGVSGAWGGAGPALGDVGDCLGVPAGGDGLGC